MVGGGTKYRYPHGKPAGLGYLEIAGFLVGICFVLFASRGPAYAAATVVAFVAFGIAHSQLLASYERTGLAVRIPRKLTSVRFKSGRPTSLVVLGHSSTLLIAVLLLFCFIPVPQLVSDTLIIAAGAALITTAIAYVVIERKYVKAGQAVKVEIEQ